MNRSTLSEIRVAELAAVRHEFPKSGTVLELGGGSGLQARVIASWGLDIRSLDIVADPDPQFPVELFDGRKIPLDDRSVDLVFSSNVIEHVEDRPALFMEMQRVLRPGGRMVHIVPSASWRLWTTLAHYPYLLKRIGSVGMGFGKLSVSGDGTGAQNEVDPGSPVLTRLRRAMWIVPHGVDRSVIREFFTYSRWGWERCFRASGLRLLNRYSIQLWYTGYGLAPRMPLERRRILARRLGSSCHVYVLTAPDAGER